MRHSLKLLLLILGLTSASSAYAAHKEQWKFTIAPYVWGINMNGSVQIANRPVRIRESFSDILRDFKGGGMLWLNADRGKVGLFANGIYAYLNRRVIDQGITFKPEVKFGIVTVGASYEVYNKTFKNCTKLEIQPYAGARYTFNDVTIKVINTSIAPSKDENWLDPIIGARFIYTMNKNWLGVFAGDIGGTNFNSQNSYNLNAFIGYVPNSAKCITLYGGYKFLYQNYSKGSGVSTYVWKMRLFGPVLGLSFAF